MLDLMQQGSFAQMAFVTEDVERAKRQFAELYGFVEVPTTCGIGTPEVARTEYHGRPAPEIDCRIAYFNFQNIQVELMEPNHVPSAWRDWLNAHGEGLHHVSFFVEDIEAGIKDCMGKGMDLVQRGLFADGDGAYAYLDTKGALPYLIELLESY